jgi:ABC-type transporter Mla subunit MlaD
LRHDRWIALLVVVALIAMMALITWLASLGGSVDPGTFNNWDLMM